MVSRDAVGGALAVGGVVLLVATLALSAALAPAIGATGDDGVARPTLVGSQGGGAGLHEHGSVYLVENDSVTWRESSANSYFDVTMLDNGTVAAGFMHGGYQQCGRYDSPCTRTGFRIIDPTAEPEPEVVSEFSFPVRSQGNSEVHDVEPLPEGGYVVSDMEYERIMVVRNGSVEWQWNASSVYEAPADPTREDWLHINDVDYIGEDRFLVSVRNANQLLVVERQGQGSEVVEVVNAVEDESDEDGVGIADRDILYSQHNPQWLGDGAVLVADSHNNRVVELHRDEQTGEWEEAWTLASAEGVNFRWPRDADRLENGNTLITDSLNGRIVEVNESGATVWSYKTEYVPYEAERLPEGERPTGQQYATAGDAGPGAVPVLTPLLSAVRASYPLPHWLNEPQLGLTLLSLGMVFGGVGAVVVGRLRGRRR
ncbi:hypothetical protein ACFO0N_06680 [Halobium salinum]|uniref:Arylsulfotransferase (ASST) n=1 Tax=Halobium salinum TaxID=1364940 RepID=A0ABD5PB05_9EURY|nr:hypothetical protein [Halobium salinum]